MYMLGQVAASRDSTCTVAELHHEVSVKGAEWLVHVAEPASASSVTRGEERPCDVAIIGMACFLPKAPNLQTYWENILNKVDAITEVPQDRWDWQRYFDADPKTPDKIYSKWGGFLDDIPFDPMRYGMPPNSLSSIEPLQLLTLEVVRAALQDAGYLERPFPRQRTAVILGVGGGVAELGNQYAVRSALPMLLEDVAPGVLARLPEWTEDSFAGILLNVAAGRVANRFDLGGVNYTVDAACASSLAAVYLATRELEAGTSDLVIVGGADTVQNPFGYLAFSKTHALSPHGRCQTFDESADGIVISEGVAILVLKRLADAERQGDRIYAVIKAVAGSSDGRDKGLTAPRPEGQALALERAYAKAGFSPATVGLIEAHGTGTVAGDQAEVETLKRVFGAAGAARQRCAIGSVKSMIGHTKCAAGVAGLLKVALALYHQVLPPTLHVTKPNSKARFHESPFYVNTETQPWIDALENHPRRAGVSAFGFGGTNFHAVLEEYTEDFLRPTCPAVRQNWPGELLLWTGNSRQALVAAVATLEQALAQGARPDLRDLACTLWQLARERSELTLAVVATSLDDLRQKLSWTQEALRIPEQPSLHDPRGIYFTEEPLARQGKVAFLFPGQGSQYPGMLRELATLFPQVRTCFEHANRILAGRLPERLSSYIFPPPRFSPEEERACQQALIQTNVAQPALGAASMGLFHLLQTLGVRPDLVAGHSYGEYIALCSAAVFNEEVLYTLSEARGRCIFEAADQDLGTMAAVAEGQARITEVLQSLTGVWIANVNAPRQTVISGTRQGVAQAIERLGQHGIQARPIPVACAFHSPVIAPARDRLATVLSRLKFGVPQVQVFSNASAAPYPDDPPAIAALLAEHLVSPVRFADEVDAMYGAGTRIFVEIGPRNVLTSLTKQTLGNRAHLAVALDAAGHSGLVQLLHTIGQLAAHGVPLQLEQLYEGRVVRQLNLAALARETGGQPLPPTAWLVNGSRARPLHDTTRSVASQDAPKQEKATGNKTQASANIPAISVVSPTPTVPTTDGAAPPSASEAERRPRAAVSQRQTPIAPVCADSPGGVPDSPEAHHEVGGIMLQFQRLMNRFLETQQQVMLSYLSGASNTAFQPTDLLSAATVPDLSPGPVSPPQLVSSGVSSSDFSQQRPPAPLVASPIETPSPATSTILQAPLSGLTQPHMTQGFVQIVSERTGYPPEMLDLDLDIEADLGIDSIKRVEILGAFQRAHLPAEDQMPQGAMEQLTRIKTLRGIIDFLGSLMQSPQVGSPSGEPILVPAGASRPQDAVQLSQKPDSPPLTSQTVSAFGDGDASAVPRFVVTTVAAPPPGPLRHRQLAGAFVITDDEGGVAPALAEALRRYGARVACVRMADRNGAADQDTYTAKLTEPAAVAALLETICRQHGSILGLMHLLPLKTGTQFAALDLTGWQERNRLEVKSLFCLAQAAGPYLQQAAETGGGWLIAATSMGGTFASAVPPGTPFLPSQGAVAGLIKTLVLEWPGVRSKVIDFEANCSPVALAEQLLAEIMGQDDEIEVGYQGSRRLLLRPKSAPLRRRSPVRLAIDPSWVVLITGGARGITAEVACELAARYQPTLLLVGRSALPVAEESPQTAGLTSPRELKAVLIDAMRQEGKPVTPAQVEAAYLRLLQDREIRSNLATMQQAGATVHYYQVDVRNAPAFEALIDDVYRQYGRLDGVIHGAGVIEDRLLADKVPDSFDRVFNTKVTSAFVLSRKLRPDTLKFLVFFSSVAGRCGNRGQSDYAAANEVMNKLAIVLNQQWPGRVVSMNWGPWAKTGMVSAEAERQFAARGIQLIEPQAGRRALDSELRYGQKGEVEVILGSGPWEATAMAAQGEAYAYVL
jgi:acyl transferase domain-containing protein/NAD(P)-dependent dehydrogenase (short-subunit alcohol dehydrogenase family)